MGEGKEPYIVELECRATGDNNQSDFCHCTVCAISDDEESAVTMAISHAMGYALRVVSVLGVALKSDLPLDEEAGLDNRLYQEALSSDPQAALFLVGADNRVRVPEVRPLTPRDTNKTKH